MTIELKAEIFDILCEIDLHKIEINKLEQKKVALLNQLNAKQGE